VDKGAKHVKQHALASVLDDFEHLHIHQGGKNNRLAGIHDAGVIDLADCLMCFVNRIDKREADMTSFGLKLGKDGIAKSFRRNAGAVGNKKNSSIGHEGLGVENGC
jgi:hypothetical protein